ARSSASRRRRANSSAIVAAVASGNRTLDDPVSVSASKNPVSVAGTCLWMNSRIARSIGPDSPPMASSLTLIAHTARTSTDRSVKRRLSSGPDQAGRSFTEQRHENVIFVLPVQFSRLPLDAFGHEAELTVERDRALVRGEHFQLYALDPRLPGGANGLSDELPAQTSSAVVWKKPHAEPADVAKPFVRIAHDVAPPHHHVIRVDGQQLYACAAKNAADELPRAFERRPCDEADESPLPRHRIDDGVKAFRMLLSRRNNAHFVHPQQRSGARWRCLGRSPVFPQHPEHDTGVCDKGRAGNADQHQYPSQRAPHEIGVE